MPVTIPEKAQRSSLLKRIGWFVLLYAGGVVAVGLLAYGIRLWIKP